jgi:penicillin-binding protein 1A
MSLVAVEPPTGYVKALVGGRDFAASQVNLALGHCPPVADTTTQSGPGPFCVDGGGTGRQPGSAFKPFTLAKAFEEGISPTRVYEAPNVYTYRHCTGVGCTVHNVEGEGGGAMTIRQATWHSVNTVFAQLVQDVGPNQVADLAHRVGITMIDPKKPHYPSITLGAEEVSPLDMASAYGVFAARGQQFPPTPVLKVLDNKGNVLEDHTKPEAKSPSPISEVIADNVTDVLRGVITSGTGTGANIGRPAAGKTGTTENYGNAWFVGYTPTLSTAVWMGYADAPRPLLNIKGVGRVYGGTIPAQTWRAFMLQALKDVPVTDFNQPAPIKPIAQDLARQLRNGFDPGDRRYPSYVGSGGPYQYFPPAPVAVAPATTTTTIEAPPTTESRFPGEPSTTSFLPGPG